MVFSWLTAAAAAAGLRFGEGDQILLALEEGAEEGHALVELLRAEAGALHGGDPVDELAGRRALAQAVDVAEIVEGGERLFEQLRFEVGVVDPDDAGHELAVGELDEV